MPPSDEKSSPSAGISSSDDDEFDAILGQLREEVGRGGIGGREGTSTSARRLAARDLAERSWIVSGDRPLERRPGLRGAALYPVKLVLHRLMSWYVEPIVADQRAFNDAVLQLVDELESRVARLEDDALP